MIGLDYINDAIELTDEILSTKRKRHIVGGTLIGVALFFGVLAITIMTTETETKEVEKDECEDY